MRRIGIMSLVLLGLAGCGLDPMEGLPVLGVLETPHATSLHLSAVTVTRPNGHQFVPTTFYNLTGERDGEFQLLVYVMQVNFGKSELRVILNHQHVEDVNARLQLAQDLAQATIGPEVDRGALQEVIGQLRGTQEQIRLDSSRLVSRKERAVQPTLFFTFTGRDANGPLTIDISRRFRTDFGPIEVQVQVNGQPLTSVAEAKQLIAQLKSADTSPAVDPDTVKQAIQILEIHFRQ